MGDMWRSQHMQLVQLIVQNDAAHAVVNKLGQVGLVQFRDLNAGTSFYKRSFVEEVRKCDDLERIIRSINEEYDETSTIVIADRDEKLSLSLTLEDVEDKLHAIEDELSELKAQQELLVKNDNALREQQFVLELGKKIYKKSSAAGAEIAEASAADKSQMAELMALSEFANASSSLLGQVAGVIKRDQASALERIIFRATRGNAVFEQMPIEAELLDVDAKGSPEPVEKVFFMVLFAGEVMREKISKICSYFGASLYKFPEGSDDYTAMVAEVERRLAESHEILSKGEQVMHEMLTNIAKDFQTWNFVVQKEKMIFDTLNMCEFDIKRHVFVAEGWVPRVQYEKVVQALSDSVTECGLDTRPIINKLESKLVPPTHVPVTKFTSGFQALVNTYGTPRYRECNPGAFCCIMFPFLFGIMFGDFGHGLLLASFGYFLISKEEEWDNKVLNDMVAMCYGGRYIILLNGLFGAYVGFLYNEAFAYPMNWFGGSRWYNSEDPSEPCEALHDGTVPICALDTHGAGPYPMGIDPIWHYTQNKISFFNSFKMKISIIVGVAQMTVGICLSLLNHIEYGDYKRIFFEYLPEMIFFEGIFGYLVFTIFYKWAVDWNGDVGVPGNPGPQPAPALLTLLINMFMAPTTDIAVPLYGHQCFTDCPTAADKCYISSIALKCPVTCSTGEEGADLLTLGMPDGTPETKVCFSESQISIQLYLLIAAFASVPFLLIPIPFIELYEHNKEMAERAKYEALDDKAEGAGGDDDDSGGFSFGDVFIHQAIHTIEFVLGSISNTASYLRLWALSLAHSQLAELFKDMVLTDIGLKNGLPPIGAGIAAFFAFAVWLVISLVVLMVMENLSSFLHALRLQWVEFQNKFYYGDGQKYTPFDFSSINVTDEEA
jgi:V-type H+-transporting ATPase subunit a